jgi:hypothetical protein
MRVAWGLRLPQARASAWSLAANGDCIRELWAKAVMALRARALAAQRK